MRSFSEAVGPVQAFPPKHPVGALGTSTGCFLYVGSANFLARQARLECPAAPAPGFRDSGWRGVAAGGTLHQVGSHGAGWSTKTAGNDTYYLRFDCGWLVPQNSSCRAYGLQLRCLQE